MAKTTIYPKITNELLTNPGIGFIAAPPLMGEHQQILDNRGNKVKPYKFTKNAITNNHPDSAVWYCGARWKDLEPQEGKYDFSSLEEKLLQAREMGCTAIVRIKPYALSEDEDIPTWLRCRYPKEPEFPFWRIDPCTTDYPKLWARFIGEFAKRYNGNPNICGVDMAIAGAWGEGGGTEFMSADAIQTIVRAYTEGFTKTPLHALLHDPISLEIIRAQRRPVGFRVDCLGDMGGFHGSEWSHMLDFYPENIQNFKMGDAWKKAPVVFEACWHMNDWYLQGWDIDYIIEESLKWHISSYNSKATTVPEAWRKSVERWTKKMGYRYEIHKVVYENEIKQGDRLLLEAIITNSGVAPCYINYQPVLRFKNKNHEYVLKCKADIRKYLPGEDNLMQLTPLIAKNISKGSYELSLAFPVPNGTTLQLAISKRDETGFYKIGKINVI